VIELLLLTAGFLCGFINSVAGGGVLLVFPVLLLGGLNPLAANITLNLVVFPGTLSAAFANRKDLKKVPKKYFKFIFPSIIGALLGLIILSKTSSEHFNEIVPWLILSAVLLFAFQPQLHKHLHRPPHMRVGSPALLVGFGIFLVSIYAGYFGAGYGFLMMGLLSFTKIHGIFKIIALKNFTAALLGFTGTVYFAFAGGIHWKYGLIAASGAIVGGYFGAKFFHKVSPHSVRAVIVVFGLILATISFFKF
jgi:uncharacterized protein